MNADAMLQVSAATVSIVLGLTAFRGRSLQHWLFFGSMLALALGAALTVEIVAAASPDRVAYLQAWGLTAQAIEAGLWLCFSFVYARGNPAHYLFRHRWGLAIAVLASVSLAAGFGKDLLVVVHDGVPEHGWWLGYRSPGKVLNVLLLLTYVAVLMNLEATFRASVGTIRWRIKYAILGMAVALGIRIYTRSQALLFSGESVAMAQVDAVGLLLGAGLMAVASTRGGFAPADIYPRSAARHSLTVAVTAGYFLIVGVLAQVVTYFGGGGNLPVQAFFVLLAFVLAVVLLLSDRLREVVRRAVSRWFHRPLHDFRRVWTLFSERLFAELTPAGYNKTATTLIAETFNILSVTIWLVDERQQRLTLGASTSTLALQKHMEDPEFAESDQVVLGLTGRHNPFNLERVTEPWAEILRRANATQFLHGGERLCLPLVAAERCIGIAVFADRVNGAPYTYEELDLLTCIGGQISAGLLNLRLTEDLMRAKELEAFQTMSAFFVHDLKNAASTLNLMLRNLPIHFDNPEFRADTLRGIGHTVQRINQLIARLGVFRNQLELKLAEVDLNEVVEKSLAGFEVQGAIRVQKELRPLPKSWLDPEQIESVITNLLVNAREAMEGEGTIRIETQDAGDQIQLTVTDEGSGMTPEFVAQSLFRPFHTTKKKGLGVGMFQSKVIVEAHRGTIRVDSAVGRGTTFHVLLRREGASK